MYVRLSLSFQQSVITSSKRQVATNSFACSCTCSSKSTFGGTLGKSIKGDSLPCFSQTAVYLNRNCSCEIKSRSNFFFESVVI